MSVGQPSNAGFLDAQGHLLDDQIYSYHSHADQDEKTLLENFINLFVDLLSFIQDDQKQIIGVGLAFPGPFDYQNGVSFIKNIGKYDHLYKVNIKQRLLEQIMQHRELRQFVDQSMGMIFENDAAAYAMGEIVYGKGKNDHKVFCICLGTGIGSAFCVNKKIVKDDKSLPNNGWLYDRPFKESIMDDYISARGLEAIIKKHYGDHCDYDCEYLSKLAEKGEPKALDAFYEFGDNLCGALIPYMTEFKPGSMVIGGQISKAFQYFKKPLMKQSEELNIDIHVSDDTTKSTLRGLYNKILVQRDMNR